MKMGRWFVHMKIQRNDIFSSKFFRRPRVDLVNRVVQFSTKTRTFNGRLVFVFVSVIVLIPDLMTNSSPTTASFRVILERAYATCSPFQGISEWCPLVENHSAGSSICELVRCSRLLCRLAADISPSFIFCTEKQNFIAIPDHHFWGRFESVILWYQRL